MFTPVLTKHTNSFNLADMEADILAVGKERIQFQTQRMASNHWFSRKRQSGSEALGPNEFERSLVGSAGDRQPSGGGNVLLKLLPEKMDQR
ncbi:MAG: hypothetical protein WCA49_15870 [Candidatus Sulfotelmatobacter sp.]